MNDDDPVGAPRHRVLVQGLDPAPFLRRFTLQCRTPHEILDLVAARFSADRKARWGVLAVDEAGGPADDRESRIVAVQDLPPLHRHAEEVLLRPWGCFASDAEALADLAPVRPGYLRFEEPDQVFCQANVSAPELRAALEAVLAVGDGPLRLVLEHAQDAETGARGRLFYADHATPDQAREFLSRNGIWTLGDGFIGLGLVSLEPFHEVFVDAHGELLIWWGSDHLADLDRYLRILAVPRHEEGDLGFVSALPHFHAPHEMTGRVETRITQLIRGYGFYEHVEDDDE
jgi:hypothetical protein